MARQVIRAASVCLLLMFAMLALAQEKEEYLDIFQIQVKPEKRADFDAIARKWADANRRNGGDTWVALESMYGEGNVITLISNRSSYGDVEKGMNSFMGSLAKDFGPEQMGKMFAEMGACTNWSRAELRRRRWDLSSNAPKEAAEYSKMVGQSRFVRTTRVVVKSGRTEEFETMMKELKAAREKSAPQNVMIVSQVVAGAEGNVYYISTLQPDMAGYDKLTPAKKFLSDEEYQKAMKSNAELVETTYTTIHRFLPEASNPPEQVAAASPDFWNPKPAVAAKKPASNKKQNKAEGQ
jgi:hypothetical protein